MKTNAISQQAIQAATLVLQPFVPDLSPGALARMLEGINGNGNAAAPATPAAPLTRREVADLLHCSLQTVSRMCGDHRLQRLKIGKRATRITRASVAALLTPTPHNAAMEA